MHTFNLPFYLKKYIYENQNKSYISKYKDKLIN